VHRDVTNLVQRWEVILVFSHIDRCESGVGKCAPLAVRLVNLLLALLDKVSHVRESNGLSVYSNILEELSEITPGSFIDVGKHSLLELGVLLELSVGTNFSMNLVSYDVLVSEHVLDLGLVDGHALFLGILHCVFLMLKAVLNGETLVLRNLSEHLLVFVGAGTVN